MTRQTFTQWKAAHQKHVQDMIKGHNTLFVMDVNPDYLWSVYLDSFAPADNKMFRQRREYDCGCCKTFIRQFGSIVAIGDDGKIYTGWDFDVPADSPFYPVTRQLAAAVLDSHVSNALVTKDITYGTDFNFEVCETGTIRWEHFRIQLPERLRYSGRETVETVMGRYRSMRHVFNRGLTELSPDALDTILELIEEKTVPALRQFASSVQLFRREIERYQAIPLPQREAYVWKRSRQVGDSVAGFNNTSVGQLAQDLTAEMELSEAIGKFVRIVDPANYRRSTVQPTQSMVDKAVNAVRELGLLSSLDRRFATLRDIHVEDVVWVASAARRVVTGELSVFDGLAKDTGNVNADKFKRTPAMSLADFMDDVLKGATTVELLLESRHKGNAMSLIAPSEPDAATLFKWGNNFCAAFAGNVAGKSQIAGLVAERGGKTDGVVRFSIVWNEEGRLNHSDLDAHCLEPQGTLIYYGHKVSGRTGGNLDIDHIPTSRGTHLVGAENITYPSLDKMVDGTYTFKVHNFNDVRGQGFRVELVVGGEVYSYDHPNHLGNNKTVTVAEVTLHHGNLTVKHGLQPHQSSSGSVFGLATNQWQPVTVVTRSPNLWSNGNGAGRQQVYFFLDGAKSNGNLSGFFPEYLLPELMPHRKVFSALANKMVVADSDDQLSGIGFGGEKDTAILRVDGKVYRVVFDE